MSSELYARLGVSNVLAPDAKVIYSRVPGRGSVGRIADLLAHASLHDDQQAPEQSDAIGVVSHLLLNAVFSIAKGSSVYVEMAAAKHEWLVSSRSSIETHLKIDEFPLGIVVWIKECWNKMPAFIAIKQVLTPDDRVEVRFNISLKLIEWRWARKLGANATSAPALSFFIIEDSSDRVYQGSEQPTELSELPFDKWLEDVYKATSKLDPTGGGEIYFQGESLQNETELSRVITQREKVTVESKVKKEMHDSCWEDGVENLELKSGIDPEDQQRVEQKAQEIVSNLEEITDARAREVVQDSKRKELRAKHDLVVMQRKSEKYEALLQEKEKLIQRKTTEIKSLNAKLMEKTGSDQFSENAQVFKEKALLMADALKKSKEDNEALERVILELRQKARMTDGAAEVGVKLPAGGANTVGQQQIEELVKKADRIARALEAEKAKVIQLSERLAASEKEAQAAGPIISDLEARVDHTLKTAQQHKKDADQVKQKLVQSEAEKNKIKNELMKAQAQIQTLMKRQAG